MGPCNSFDSLACKGDPSAILTSDLPAPSRETADLLAALGGSVRFADPPEITAAGSVLEEAFLDGGTPYVRIDGSVVLTDIPVKYTHLSDEAAANVLRILRKLKTDGQMSKE